MARRTHTESTVVWGTRVPAKDSNQYGILKLNSRTRPIKLGDDGADDQLPGINDQRTARQLAKQGFVYCVFPGCGPYQTTVHRKGRHRDGFKHADGAADRHRGSAPETLDHLNSKTAILHWMLNECAGQVSYFDDDTENIKATVGAAQTFIRPDAYVELHSGAKIAVEFQHSPGDPQRILDKTSAYRRLGIKVWWIFSGRNPLTCKNAEAVRGSNNLFRADMNSAQIHLVKDRIQFFWYDYERNLIATPTIHSRIFIGPKTAKELWEEKTPTTRERYWRFPFPRYKRPVMFWPETLNECNIEVETGNLLTKMVRKHRADAERAHEEEMQLRKVAEARYTAHKNVELIKERAASALIVQNRWHSLDFSRSTAPPTAFDTSKTTAERLSANPTLTAEKSFKTPVIYASVKKPSIARRFGDWITSLFR